MRKRFDVSSFIASILTFAFFTFLDGVMGWILLDSVFELGFLVWWAIAIFVVGMVRSGINLD